MNDATAPMWPLPPSLWLYSVFLLPLLPLIYNRYFHPLRNISGPFLASLSPLWIAYQAYHQRRPRLDLQLHRKYGPIVRISPNEVIFSDPECFKEVYGAGSKFAKGGIYEATRDWSEKEGWEKLDMLAERDVVKLRMQKRGMGKVYSAGNVVRHEEPIDENIMRFWERLDGMVGVGSVVDIYRELELLNVDLLSGITFGKSFGAMEKGSDEGHLEGMNKVWEWWGWIGYLEWVNWVDKCLSPWKTLFTGKGAESPVMDFAHTALSTHNSTTTPCLYTDLLSLSSTSPSFLPSWYRKLAITNLGAGLDTMSWTLCTVIVCIAQHPQSLQTIQLELDSAGLTKSPNEPISYYIASKLHYLQASIHESQRLYPFSAISFPRIVPPGPGITISGHHIPPGYTVGMAPRALGQSSSIFGPSPELFRPERWLEADASQRREMEMRNLAFGGPSRKCPGMNLAWVLLSKILASFYLRYEVKVLNEIDGKPGPGGSVWREKGSFPTRWEGLEVEIVRRKV